MRHLLSGGNPDTLWAEISLRYPATSDYAADYVDAIRGRGYPQPADYGSYILTLIDANICDGDIEPHICPNIQTHLAVAEGLGIALPASFKLTSIALTLPRAIQGYIEPDYNPYGDEPLIMPDVTTPLGKAYWLTDAAQGLIEPRLRLLAGFPEEQEPDASAGPTLSSTSLRKRKRGR